MINGELIVDNFAGGGGASTGIEMATGYSVDIAINHDPEAIRMHKANHPGTKHYCESVWDVDPIKACKGHPVGLAWFSPDCKHFSKAKGGKPKDKTIRGLAWVACRWAGKVRPRVIMLENVEEFKTWGPLNRSHRPIKAKQGATFQRFVCQLEALGYTVEFRELTAADYGAPTMRKRFFMIARCDGKPIVWPEPTHAPADSEAVKAGLLQPYVGAYTQIDFSRPCPSIFDSAEEIKEKYGIRAVRPLAPKTMERIARGLKKFVIDNAEPFIVQVNHSGSDWNYCKNMNEPLPVITSKHGFGIVEPYMVQIGQTGFTADRSKDVREPLTTIVSKNEHCLISPTLIQYHSETAAGEVRGQTTKEPIMTVDSSNRYGLVTSFLSKFYKIGTGQDVREPLGTVTSAAGGGHFGEVQAFFERYDLYESDRCDKRADRTRNNSNKTGRKILENSEQTVSPERNCPSEPEENGSNSKIRLSGNSSVEGRKTISDACTSSNMGDICRRNTDRDGYKPQERGQAGQQAEQSGSSNQKPEFEACSRHGIENIQQLSGDIFRTGESIEGERAFILADRQGIENIPDCSISRSEFQAHTLIKYYGQGTGQAVTEPLDTIPTHDRFGLVTIQGIDYQIVDIGLRMLEPKELYGCQGFPDDYIIDRDYTGKEYPRSEQVKRCGNAVCPPLPEALVRTNLPELCVAERTPNMRIETEQSGQLRFA